MSGNSFIPGGVKNSFFDTKKVQKYADRKSRRMLAIFGYRVRRSARQKIRKRKSTSAPGKPPTDQTGRLKRSIFFYYDHLRQSVVIGPVVLPNSTMAQETLEHGGAVQMKSRPSFRKRRGAGRKKTKIEARPYMGPAWNQELPGLDELWRKT
jgi:hypothetical protein